jgi:hypothetical protein
MNKKTLTLVSIVALAVVAGGFFYLGSLYGASHKSCPFTPGTLGLRNRGGGASTGANFISGTIISSDSTKITLQLPSNGGSKIIFYSATTPISKMASGTSADLSAGTSVSVTGAANTDGTITAQMIQIRPAGQNPGQNQPAPAQ